MAFRIVMYNTYISSALYKNNQHNVLYTAFKVNIDENK